MKRRITGLLAFLLLSAGVAALAGQAIGTNAIGDGKFIAGLVVAMNPAAGTITVEEAGSDRRMTFHILRDTDIRKDGVAIRLGSIQVGDPVAIEFQESGRGPLVTSVKVITLPRGE